MQHINSTFKFEVIIEATPVFLEFFLDFLSFKNNSSLILIIDITNPKQKIITF